MGSDHLQERVVSIPCAMVKGWSIGTFFFDITRMAKIVPELPVLHTYRDPIGSYLSTATMATVWGSCPWNFKSLVQLLTA